MEKFLNWLFGTNKDFTAWRIYNIAIPLVVVCLPALIWAVIFNSYYFFITSIVGSIFVTLAMMSIAVQTHLQNSSINLEPAEGLHSIITLITTIAWIMYVSLFSLLAIATFETSVISSETSAFIRNQLNPYWLSILIALSVIFYYRVIMYIFKQINTTTAVADNTVRR